MTPGQEALREAMRLEQARIYARCVSETPTETEAIRDAARPARPGSAEFREQVLTLRGQAMPIARIALWLGVTRAHVEWVVHRAERAS